MKAFYYSKPAFVTLVTLLISGLSALAQKPEIGSIDKTSGRTAEVVSMQGRFGTNPANFTVQFGAARGKIKFVSDQLLEAQVPPGATFDNIVVTNLGTGLSDYSRAQFLYSFGGDHGLAGTNFEGQADFDAETGLYDLCMCDFDNDGRNDFATANDNSNSITLLSNTTPNPGLGNIALTKIPTLINARSIHATCGDLNGDGKPDLLISEGGSTGDRIFVFRNTSTGVGNITFSVNSIKITDRKVKRMEIADLDDDGKPEVIITNQTGNTLTILVNQSTPAAISFAAARITLTVTGAASTDGLQVQDINNDRKPEIITSQFLTATSNIFIFPNTSIPGSIAFGAPQTLPIGGTVVNLRVGDLNGDGKPEIAATQLLGSGISIFRNQSTPTAISFGAPVPLLTEERPWGIDFGDLDGDGLADIVVASLTKKSITVLHNKSTTGTFSFQSFVLTTTFINRHVNIGDVDGDGKPDIAFTSVDDNNTGVPASKVSIIRNKSCLEPEVTPEGPLTICAGFPLKLETTPSKGSTFEWRNGTTIVATGPDPFFNVVASGDYTVTVISEGGACSETSDEVSITVNPGTTTGTATPVNDGPVCVGSTATLSVNDVGGTAYNWTGPEGYTGTGLTPAPITNFQRLNAGRYYLDVMVGSCIAQQASTVIDAIDVPDFRVSFTGSEVICPPDTKTLSIVPNLSSYSYQWYEQSAGIITGATSSTLTVSASGAYYVEAKYIPNPNCATVQTSAATITFSSPPIAGFTAPTTACVGEIVSFTNQSTGDSGLDLFYSWNFGSAGTSTDKDPQKQFSSAGNIPVTLTVTYKDGACPDVETKNISIQSAPALTITTPGNVFIFCPGDSLKLEAPTTFSSYSWSTNATTSFIYVKEAGTYSLTAGTGTCNISASKEVQVHPEPVVEVTADPERVNEGQSTQLNATGLTTFEWEPAGSLSDPEIANPVATPLETTEYTVRGKDTRGCIAEGSVTVSVIGDAIVDKLTPARFFSPNNADGQNDFWRIEKIDEFPQCTVSVFDDKGIKVYESKGYENNWDGTYNGKQLPDGVYFFVIRCEGEENKPKTGSITLLR